MFLMNTFKEVDLENFFFFFNYQVSSLAVEKKSFMLASKMGKKLFPYIWRQRQCVNESWGISIANK